MGPPSPHPFIRKPVEGSQYLLLESTCVFCGFLIVGSAAKTLQQDEDKHAENCAKERLKAEAQPGAPSMPAVGRRRSNSTTNKKAQRFR